MSIGSDLKLALRSLLKSPGFTAVAVATLAVAIGLNTAVFSVVDAVVFKPLPFAKPDRLIALCELERGEQLQWCGSSVPDLYEVAERSQNHCGGGGRPLLAVDAQDLGRRRRGERRPGYS